MVFYMEILNFIFSSQTSGELKIILMVHFTLTALGGMACVSSFSYVFYNSAIILTLLWSIHDKPNLEPLRLMVGLELCAILIDLFYFSVMLTERSTLKESVSAAMIFLQCIIRPCVVLHLSKTKNNQEFPNSDTEDDTNRTLSIERGERNMKINDQTYCSVPVKTNVTDPKQSVENNPFENDYAELS
ncbi:uncharacterized protein LOC130453360 isoform X1 [Diorhabda sublineata]|uniref:uncharacterized protein LOC130453360 isoform X1 n=1 Tax=Diorhabda sublineata TaxID=1163346 RepID=UPI0024E08758|nr:uncharacterized protein LOC130453360 isoform X1 [Diorhabda sublineata]